MPVQTDFYSIPSLYDILHTPGTAAEVDGLERIALRHCTTPAGQLRWFEPACGTGRYLRLAASRGTPCVGIDLSESMVDYARDRIARMGLTSLARIEHADMTDCAHVVNPASIDFAFNLINTIRHLETDDAMLAHLHQVCLALAPGGVYAVGITLSAPDLEMPSEDIWHAKRGRCTVRQIVNYLPPVTRTERARRKERVISHLHVTRPTGSEHIDSSYSLRTYTADQWTALIDCASMTTRALVDERGNPTLLCEPGYAIWILSPKS